LTAFERLKAEFGGHKKRLEGLEKKVGDILNWTERNIKRVDRDIKSLGEMAIDYEARIKKLERPWWKRLFRIKRKGA